MSLISLDFTAEQSEPLFRLMTISLGFGKKSASEATVTIGAQLTSTQKGKVTEQMVASALLIASDPDQSGKHHGLRPLVGSSLSACW